MLTELSDREKKLLENLQLTQADVYRLRSVRVSKGNIVLYTQAGGPNRVCYCEHLGELDVEGNPVLRPIEIEKKKHEVDCSMVLTEKLRQHPRYVEDFDLEAPDGSKNFANFYFKYQ